ncbi:Uncharacterised protein [BD1-7 clade bacterium]|uniref:Uncharacterized protein n=1 Tax=BD1-7 clade bacterium TaxID=2029982 RepID=A0A5S9Q5T4_9GAMM|nr:Uncharacterised protein [BD1-7 clade bacterium]
MILPLVCSIRVAASALAILTLSAAFTVTCVKALVNTPSILTMSALASDVAVLLLLLSSATKLLNERFFSVPLYVPFNAMRRSLLLLLLLDNVQVSATVDPVTVLVFAPLPVKLLMPVIDAMPWFGLPPMLPSVLICRALSPTCNASPVPPFRLANTPPSATTMVSATLF